MDVYLVQVRGHEISDALREAEGKDPRYCDDLINHGIYINAEGEWREKKYNRRKAWNTIQPGDKVLLYCTTSVKEYEGVLSHIFTVKKRDIDNEQDVAKLAFKHPSEELDQPIPYGKIKHLVEEGTLSEKMGYCGRPGFKFTKVDPHDLEIIRMFSKSRMISDETSPKKDSGELFKTKRLEIWRSLWNAFKILFWIGSVILIGLFLIIMYSPLLLAKSIANYLGIEIWGLYGAVNEMKLGLLFVSMIYLLISNSIFIYVHTFFLDKETKAKIEEKQEKRTGKEQKKTYDIIIGSLFVIAWLLLAILVLLLYLLQ